MIVFIGNTVAIAVAVLVVATELPEQRAEDAIGRYADAVPKTRSSTEVCGKAVRQVKAQCTEQLTTMILLIEVGEGEQSTDWVAEVLESRDRKRGGIAAPPHGLTLTLVDYPESAGIMS